MGHDYSYSQPSSSDDYAGYSEDTEDREISALIRMDEAESNFIQAEANQYPPQPEVEFGFPKICYCGAQPLLHTCYTRTDPGRRFYTCGNASDGEMHIHKWWHVAVMEELTSLSDTDDYLDQIRATIDENEHKQMKLEKLVDDLRGKNKRFNSVSKLVGVIVALSAIVIAFLVRFN